MVKVKKKEGLYKESRIPKNLDPLVFQCKDCGCTIRRLPTTDSFILMSVHTQIEKGKRKICSFCYRLKQYQGIE